MELYCVLSGETWKARKAPFVPQPGGELVDTCDSEEAAHKAMFPGHFDTYFGLDPSIGAAGHPGDIVPYALLPNFFIFIRSALCIILFIG